MICRQCNSNNLIIEQAPDSFVKRVRCLSCGFTQWLKYFNKKTLIN